MTLALRISLVACLICLLREVVGVLHGATIEELDNLFAEYEIVRPTVVTAHGEFLSHVVRRAAPFAPAHERERRSRRSVEDAETVVLAIGSSTFLRSYNNTIDVRNDMLYASANESAVAVDYGIDEDPSHSHVWNGSQAATANRGTKRFLHFNVSAFGQTMQLQVQSKERLVAPGAKSIIFTPEGRRIEKDILSDCAFFGKISRMPGSTVAISNCDGLAGLIKTKSEEYFIEPIEQHSGDPAKPQNHVIYRRSAARSSGNYGKRMEREKREEREKFDGHKLRESLGKLLQNTMDDSQARSRNKRHAKRNSYNMEMMLTADSEVVRFHGSDHVENYMLTLINIVDEIYHDDSLGHHINIILTRIYQLDEARSTRLIEADEASTSLKNVCKWADDILRVEPPAHGRAHDNAVFLTRRSFGPAGYAHVNGMCHPLRSCSLNHEDGFSSAFVIAHETGHVLGMEHDGEGNKCGDETSMGSLMAPLVQAAFHRYHWSRCSQQELHSNIEQFHCLMDDPHRPNWGPTPVYPGVTYSVDDQCRFDFGQGYRRCTAFPNVDLCKTLWCSHDDNPMFCKTKKSPPVDGTDCGENMWCFKSHCVRKDQRQVVDGSWGPWSTYGDCSRTCGTGVMYRTRKCDRPPPSNGGRDCLGQNMDPDLCNKRPCPRGSDFRADQCTFNNGVAFRQQKHKWLPYEHPKHDFKCDLFCVSRRTNLVASMGDVVEDGTRCSYEDPHGICIRGECVNIGCDNLIGSLTREDACGVCGGDGRQCRNITRQLTKRTIKRPNSYMKVYKIPQGARHIRIQEVAANDNSNILALKSRADRRYFLNARNNRLRFESLPFRVVSAGTIWRYDSNSDGVETITAIGPTDSVVTLVILVQERNLRTQLQYSYVLHMSDLPRQRDTYRYAVKRWSSCPVTCGVGYRKAKYGCRSVQGERWVSKRHCAGRPPKNNRKECKVLCSSQTSWFSHEWSPCSKTCGGNGVSYRNVTCRETSPDGSSSYVSSNLCSGQEKPTTQRQCSTSQCPAMWRQGPWSQCSVTCGEGIQRRQVLCRARARSVSTSACTEPKPDDVQRCFEVECERVTTTTQRPVTTTGSAISVERCVSDQSIFCKLDAIASYCHMLGYRKLCCKACARHDRERGNQLGGSLQHPLSVAVTQIFPNGTSNGSNPQANDGATSSTTAAPREEGALVQAAVVYLQGPTVSADPVDSEREVEYPAYDESNEGENNEDIPDIELVSLEDIQTLAPGEVTTPTAETPQASGEEARRDHLPEVNTGARSLEHPQRNRRLRRERRSSDIVPVLRGWEKCRINGECGAGRRRAIYGCWEEQKQAWATSKDCVHPDTSQTVCVVPCYQSVRASLRSSKDEKLAFRSRATCRVTLKGGLGPRTNWRRCSYSRRASARSEVQASALASITKNSTET